MIRSTVVGFAATDSRNDDGGAVSPPGGRGYGQNMDDNGPGDGRSIENPDEEPRIQDDAPVRGATADDVGSDGERVSEPGDGLVTEEGVNEPGTKR